MKITLSLFGLVPVSLEVLGNSAPPPVPVALEPKPEGKPKPQPEGETPGPITERVSAPVTHTGFGLRIRHADGRERWTG